MERSVDVPEDKFCKSEEFARNERMRVAGSHVGKHVERRGGSKRLAQALVPKHISVGANHVDYVSCTAMHVNETFINSK
jgi:hypothetical protein